MENRDDNWNVLINLTPTRKHIISGIPYQLAQEFEKKLGSGCVIITQNSYTVERIYLLNGEVVKDPSVSGDHLYLYESDEYASLKMVSVVDCFVRKED